VINYTETPDWDAKARELTDGRGVDCVVEIGGPGTIAKSLKALAVRRTCQLDRREPIANGDAPRPLIVDWPRHYGPGQSTSAAAADFEVMNRAIALHRCDR